MKKIVWFLILFIFSFILNLHLNLKIYALDIKANVKFEDYIKQIVAEEVNKAFEKYDNNVKKKLTPEEMNFLISTITDQIIYRAVPLITGEVAKDDTNNIENIVLAKIKNKPITASDVLEEYLKLPQSSKIFLNTVEKVKNFLNDVVIINQIIQMEAINKKIADKDEVKQQINKAFENLLIETYFKQIKDNISKSIQIDENEIVKYYEENKKEKFQIKDCITLANIFVKFDANDSTSIQIARNKIEKAKVELDVGVPFEKVWEKYSDDKTHTNGVLGVFKKDTYSNNPIISEAFARNRGEYTNIIKGNNGFYILKVLEKNEAKTIPLNDVKTIIENELKTKKENEKLEEWFKTIKSKYEIKIFHERIGGEPDTVEVNTKKEISNLNVLKERIKLNESNDKPIQIKSSKEKNKSKNLKVKKNNKTKTTNIVKSENNLESKKNVLVSQDLNEVLAIVNDVKITRLDYNESIAQLPNYQKINLNKHSDRLSIIEKIINRIVLKKEALLAQVQNLPSFKKEIKDLENKIIARALIFEEVTKKLNEPSEQELKAYFKKNSNEYQVRHILISVKNINDTIEVENAKKQAMLVYKKALTSDFNQLAKQYSEDVSKNDGGLLPPFTYDDMAEAFSEAVLKLKIGEVSKPVLTNFGFHIIKLENIKPLSYVEIKNKLKEKISGAAQKKALNEYIEKLKEEYPFEILESNIQLVIDKNFFQR